MTVTIKLFAAIREIVGSEDVSLDLSEGASIADIKRSLSQQFPQIEGLILRSVVAKNHDYALDTDVIGATDDLAVIPPVSGG